MTFRVAVILPVSGLLLSCAVHTTNSFITFDPPEVLTRQGLSIQLSNTVAGDSTTSYTPIVSEDAFGSHLVPESLFITARPETLVSRLECTFHEENGDNVHVYSSLDLGRDVKSVTVSLGLPRGLSYDPIEGTSSEHTLDRLNYKHVWWKYAQESGPTRIDPSIYVQFDATAQVGDRVSVISLGGIGLQRHFGKGNWTYRLSWSIGERVELNSIRYVNSLLYYPYMRGSSLLGGLLTPDLELTRSFGRSRAFQVFAGLDIIPATNYAEKYQTEPKEDDWYDGILYSPRMGVQIRLFVFNLRTFISANYFDRFNQRITGVDLKPTFGFRIGVGPEFGLSNVPCECNPANCEQE